MVSDYFISGRTWTTQTPTIDGGPQAVTAPSGGLYLEHPTAALSLLARVVAAMTAASVADPQAYITELGYVRLVSSASFAVTWNLATVLRDLLGFAGDLSGASAYTAENRSTLLWRAGKRVTPERSPLGTHGQPVKDVSAQQGPRGVQTVRQEGLPTVVQIYSARYIPRDRFWASTSPVAGEFAHFWDQELSAGRQWYLLAGASEGTSPTAAADLSGATALGPYVADMTNGDMRRLQFAREQSYERVEAYYPIRIPCIQCSEFSA